MYYHAPALDVSLGQKTFVAVSADGLNFQPYSAEILGHMYMRVFPMGVIITGFRAAGRWGVPGMV